MITSRARVGPSSCQGSWSSKDSSDIFSFSAVSVHCCWSLVAADCIVSKREAFFIHFLRYTWFPNGEIPVSSRTVIIVNPLGFVVALISVQQLDRRFDGSWILSVRREITVVEFTSIFQVVAVSSLVEVSGKGSQLLVVGVSKLLSDLERKSQDAWEVLNLNFSHRNWSCGNIIFGSNPALQLISNCVTSGKHCSHCVGLCICMRLGILCFLYLVIRMRGTTAC